MGAVPLLHLHLIFSIFYLTFGVDLTGCVSVQETLEYQTLHKTEFQMISTEKKSTI